MQTHSEHAMGPKTYLAVLVALLTLTAITVAVAGIQFGSNTLAIVTAMTIASVKGSLVALYFMHLRHEKPMLATIFLSGLFALAMFFILAFIDTGARDDPRPPNVPAVLFLYR